MIPHIGEIGVYRELGLFKEDPVRIVLKENTKPNSGAAPHCISTPLLPRAEELN